MRRLHGKLSPRLTGLPYLADRAACLGGSPHLSCKRDQDKIGNYMDRRVTPPRRVTSPTWGPPPPPESCKAKHVCIKTLYIPSRLKAEITRNCNGRTRSVKRSHFGIISVVNRPYYKLFLITYLVNSSSRNLTPCNTTRLPL